METWQMTEEQRHRRMLPLYEIREQRIRNHENNPNWADELPHRKECDCPCHAQIGVDDGECGALQPSSSILHCCYEGERRPSCGGCGRSTWHLHEIEGLKLCRACRRAIR